MTGAVQAWPLEQKPKDPQPLQDCLQGKFYAKSMPSLVTFPAQAVGELLNIDMQELAIKSSGGIFCYIDSIDKFSSDVQVTLAKSHRAGHILSGLVWC